MQVTAKRGIAPAARASFSSTSPTEFSLSLSLSPSQSTPALVLLDNPELLFSCHDPLHLMVSLPGFLSFAHQLFLHDYITTIICQSPEAHYINLHNEHM